MVRNGRNGRELGRVGLVTATRRQGLGRLEKRVGETRRNVTTRGGVAGRLLFFIFFP